MRLTALGKSSQKLLAKNAFRSAIALGLVFFCFLTFVEVFGSPGSLVRSHISARKTMVDAHSSEVSTPSRTKASADRARLNDAVVRAGESRREVGDALSAMERDIQTRLASDGTTAGSELAEVVRLEPTAKQAWQHVAQTTRAVTAPLNAIDSLLNESRSLPEDSEQLTVDSLSSKLKLRTDELNQWLSTVPEAKKDLEHLHVLLEARRFEKQLGR